MACVALLAVARAAGAQPADPAAPATDAQRPAASSIVSRSAPDNVTVRAVRLDAPLSIDGRLDEGVYTTVPPISDFIQQEPQEGQPATEKTEAWILFDGTNIYISARMWDSHPEREIANELRRDNGNILGNENFTFVIDTFHDKRNGYMFQTNPLGALRDMTITDDQQNSAWNGIWYVKTDRFEQGWTHGGGDPLQVAALSRQRCTDVGHQPAAAGEVEERVLVSVARAGGARHDGRQPHGLGGDGDRHRDAVGVEEPGAEALRGVVRDDQPDRLAARSTIGWTPTPGSTSSTG